MKQNIKFAGTLQVPGDKSVSHRALIFAALARGTCQLSRLSPAADCQSTISCLRQLGVKITGPAQEGNNIYQVEAAGLEGLSQPLGLLDAGNSGTTIRLLAGLLAGRPWQVALDGDSSLRRRPMGRVLEPLCQMGARVEYNETTNMPPFTIFGGKLSGKAFRLAVASAQVQTALLLAGLQADGETSVELPAAVRDHTERLFEYIGIPVKREVKLDAPRQGFFKTTVGRLERPIAAFNLAVPGDISSAAFFMVAAACAPGSFVTLTDVGLNPGRTLVIDVLREMGADIDISDRKEEAGEPIGTVTVRGSGSLKGVTISGDRIAAGIDEIPALALAGAFCEDGFSVRDAAELRIKESDRLSAMVINLRHAGATVRELPDGMDVSGTTRLNGNSDWVTYGDHRLAMAGLVASLLAYRPITVDDTACIKVSYPQFQHHLSLLTC